MRTRSWCLITAWGVVTGFGTQEARAQIVSLHERDQDGGVYDVSPSPGIVDINSSLTIRISRDSVRARAVALVSRDTVVSNLVRSLSALQHMAEEGLRAMGPAIKDWSASAKDRAANETLANQLTTVTSAGRVLIDAANRDPALRQLLNAALRAFLDSPGSNPVDLYRMLFDSAASYATRLRAARDGLLKGSAVYFQMGAWIDSDKGLRPLHLQGFDEYPQGEPYDVERFGFHAIALTKSQMDSLQQLGQLARSWRQEGADNLFHDVLSSVQSAMRDGLAKSLVQIRRCEPLKVMTDSVLAGRSIAEDARAALETSRKGLKQLEDELARLTTKYGAAPPAGSPDEWLSAGLDNVQGLIKSGLDLLVAMARIPAARNFPAREIAMGERLWGSVEECRGGLMEVLDQIVPTLRNSLRTLQSVGSIETTVVDFDDQVRKFDIDSIPSEIVYPLRNSGARTGGDRFVIKAALGRQGEQHGAMEERNVVLFRVLPHLETTVGLIFADPFGQSDVKPRFQPAASYSVLYKKGSRKSVWKNKLSPIGFGINVAALDFNHDDTPEIGVGLVVSFLGDYFQGGVGFDIPRDQAYWFLGLRLPVPGLSGGASNATSQD